METPKATVFVNYNGEFKYDAKNLAYLSALKYILSLRYIETIREEEGGTYGVRIRTSVSKWPLEKASMQINFDCDPERASDLKEKVYAELRMLASKGPSEEDLSKTTENILKDREESKEHNAYYLSTLMSYYLYGINFDDPANYEDIVNEITAKDVKKVMQSFYADSNIIDVVFVPKEEAAAE